MKIRFTTFLYAPVDFLWVYGIVCGKSGWTGSAGIRYCICMKIKIIQVGKNKDAWLDKGTVEFLKLLKGFCDLEIVSLKEVPSSKTFPAAKAVEEEGNSILNTLEDKNALDFVVVLDEKGRMCDSVEFSEILRGKKDIGRRVVFVIGGAFGLSDRVRERADLILSFSKMTFTHQMIRLFLFEQIYRAFTIIDGKEYHH